MDCIGDMLGQRLVRPCGRVEDVPDFGARGRRLGPCGRVLKFCGF